MFVQVIDLQKTKLIKERDSLSEGLQAAQSQRDEAVQQLSELHAQHQTDLQDAAAKARCHTL